MTKGLTLVVERHSINFDGGARPSRRFKHLRLAGVCCALIIRLHSCGGVGCAGIGSVGGERVRSPRVSLRGGGFGGPSGSPKLSSRFFGIQV